MTFIINPGSSYVDNIQYILMYTIGLQSKKARYVLNNTLVLLGYEAKRQYDSLKKTTYTSGYQCCHSTLISFPYNKNEESLDVPTQSETKNAIIFNYNIWP